MNLHRPDGSCATHKITTSNTVLVLVHEHEGLRWPRSDDIRHFPKHVKMSRVTKVGIKFVPVKFVPVHPPVHGNASDSRVCLATDPHPGFIRRALVDGRR